MKIRSTEEQLKTLASIRPDPVFLKWSRKAILAEIARTTETREGAHFWQSLFSPGRSAYAAGAAGVFAVALLITGAPKASPASSLSGEAIATERRMIAAENNTAEVRYFKGISPAVSLALTDIIEPKADYGSANHIKKGIALLDKKN